MQSRRLVIGLAWFATSLVACAKGGAFVGTGGSSEGGSGGSQTTTATSSGSSNGGGGQTGTTTSDTGGGGQTGTTTTTTMCSDDPCKLVEPQCGCDDGKMCAIQNTGVRICHTAGTKQLDEACVGLYGCAAGLLCLTASSSKSICGKYCDSDNQCGGGLCLITLNDPGNPGQVLADTTLCSADCNPLTNAGCPANLGLGCQLGQEPDGQMRTFSICSGAGSGAQGTTCTDSEDCVAGSACFTLSDNSLQCLKYCNVAASNCPGATTCSPFTTPLIYKNVEYGACL